jgi:hypothetical protein
MTLRSASVPALASSYGAGIAAVRSSPIPEDGCSVRCRNDGCRLARAARLFAMRQPADRYGCERDEAAPRVARALDAAPRQPLGWVVTPRAPSAGILGR